MTEVETHVVTVTRDRENNLAYIKIRDVERGGVKTITVLGDILMDIDGDGRLCGIELLAAALRLGTE